jgi:hypothetical protein
VQIARKWVVTKLLQVFQGCFYFIFELKSDTLYSQSRPRRAPGLAFPSAAFPASALSKMIALPRAKNGRENKKTPRQNGGTKQYTANGEQISVC